MRSNIQGLWNGTKRLLNAETCLKHVSKPLLDGFGRELSKPTLPRIMDLACKARQSINRFLVFSDPFFSTSNAKCSTELSQSKQLCKFVDRINSRRNEFSRSSESCRVPCTSPLTPPTHTHRHRHTHTRSSPWSKKGCLR
jgi:hypothetical protein